MHPPVDERTPGTLPHAIHLLRQSDRPLTAKEILKSAAPSVRKDTGRLEALLAQTSGVFAWPPKGRTAPPRYWVRQPEDVVDSLLTESLANGALTVNELLKKAAKPLGGFSAPQRRALLESRASAMAATGNLYLHPPAGKTKAKYGTTPPHAGPYVIKLQQELDALAAKLAPAGITRDQILDALRGEPPAPPLEPQITAYLMQHPGGIGVARLREALGLSPTDKIAFDQAVLSLYRQHRVHLDPHHYPQGLDEAARNDLVSDGSGAYFVVIGWRDADAESLR
jgi:hypothetical protein